MNDALAAPDHVSPTDRAVTIDTQEVRLATTMTGGVSLAIWMGGVAREIDLLMQASKSRSESMPVAAGNGEQNRGALNAADATLRDLYYKLIQLLDVVVEVDVLSGTSAGGVNAAMLAYARANNGDLGKMRDLWLNLGALLDLLRQPTDSDVPSLLYGDRWIFRQLADKLKGLGSPTPPTHLPSTTLYITTTLLTGEAGRFTDSMGTLVQDSSQRGLFTFTEKHLAGGGIENALALAGRSTASFPGAFEPSFIPFFDPTPADGDIPARPAMAEFSDLTRDHWVVDGGVLDNQPLDVLLECIFDRPATRPVRRVLLFVVPTPGPAPDLIEAAPVDLVTKPYGLLPGLLKVVSATSGQSISASLRAIVSHNDRIESRTELRTQLADLAKRLTAPYRLLTPGLLDSFRDRQGVRQARKLVAAAMRQLSTWPPKTAATPAGIPEEWQPLLRPGGTAETLLRDVTTDTLLRQWPPGRTPNGAPSTVSLPVSTELFAQYGQSAYDNGKSIAIAVVHLAYQAATTPADRRNLTKINADIHAVSDEPVRPDPAELAERIFRNAISTVPPAADGMASFRQAGTDLAQTWIAETGVDGNAWLQVATVLKAGAQLITEVSDTTAMGSDLRTYVEYLGLGEDAPSISMRLFDLAVAEQALLPVDVGNFQPVELVQVSADTRSLLTPGTATAGDKLTGLQFHNFGAFYKESWRANDWMWGRLDGAGWLVHTLLDPRRLLVVTGHQKPEDRAAWLLTELETFGPVPLDRAQPIDGTPMRDVLTEELGFLGGTGKVPPSVPNTSMWLASAWQTVVAADELPKMAEVILGVPRPLPAPSHVAATAAGTSPPQEPTRARRKDAKTPKAGPVDRSPSETLTWAAAVLEPGVDLNAQLARCPVPKEKFETDVGSPLMVRTLSKAAATTTAAVASVEQVPGPVRPAVSTAHTIALGGYRIANKADAQPRNLIIVGLVLLVLGAAAATQSADVFGIAGLIVAAIGAYLVTFGTWQRSGKLVAALVAVTITGAVAVLAFPAVRKGLFGTSQSDGGYLGRHTYWLGSEWWHPLIAVGVLVLIIALSSAAFSRAKPRRRIGRSGG